MKKKLTKAEEQIMQAIWRIKKGFAKDILEALKDPKPAYNTVLTVVRVLVTKGFVNFKTYGKSNEYYPVISKEDYSKDELSSIKSKYFNNSTKDLLSFFIKENEIDLKGLNEIIKELNDKDERNDNTLIEINFYLLLIGGLYFVARTFLSNIWRRLLLLLMPIIAFIIFIIKSLNQAFEGNFRIPSIELNAISIQGDIESVFESSNTFLSIPHLYFFGISVITLLTVFKIFKALSLFRKATLIENSKVYLVTSDYDQSFTFFNRIHLSNKLSMEEREIVLEHELLHVKYNHTWDLILMEIYHALLWFNPIIIFFKKELVYVHEYQVDHDMYLKHENNYLKHLLASSMGVNSSQLLLTSQFYNGLSLTQRTKQMKRKIKNNWKFLALIPALAVGLIFISFTSKSPKILHDVEIITHDTVYNFADVPPQFPGGQEAMIEFIVENIKYPEEEKKQKIEGTVYCSFIVTKDGEIHDMIIEKTINVALEEEVLRVVSMMPKWIPGEKEGKKVNVKFTLPVKFKLPE